MINNEKTKEQLKQRSIHYYIVSNKLRTEKNTALNWNEHGFLFDIYDDWTPVQTCIKSSQIGFSTMVILKSLYAAKYKNWNIIYTLPTTGDVWEFVSSKVNKIIENNSCLVNLVKDKDTTFQKQVGDSVIFYKGTTSSKAKGVKTQSNVGIMLSSDLNIHDESDRSDQLMIEQYESRLDFSKYKGRWYFSNPTVPNVGAHKHFLLSDQKHWFHKCSRCNKYFYLQWNKKCVDKQNKKYLCPKCHKPLRDEDRSKGIWVRKYKNKTISGYWINQMMAPWKSCAELIRKENESTKTHFMNFCLGLPYVGSDVVVNRDIIVKNIVMTVNKQQNVAMGIDNGIWKHYVIGNEQGIFEIGKTKDWDKIEKLIKKYKATTVIDALPYPKKVMQLVEKYNDKVFASYYKRDKDDLGIIQWGRKEKFGTVYLDRTKIFDMVIDEFHSKNITFNINHLELQEYIEHWEDLYLEVVEDSMGIERTIWQTATKNDHYAHATNYWRAALEYAKNADGSVTEVEPDNSHKLPFVDKDNKVQMPDSDVKFIFEKTPQKNWDEY